MINPEAYAAKVAETFKEDKRLQRAYEKYNAEYFGNTLSQNVHVGWANLREDEWTCDLGVTTQHADEGGTFYRICLSPKLKQVGWSQVLLVLLHEMVHVKLLPYRYHGKRFQNEMKRLAIEGAMESLW